MNLQDAKANLSQPIREVEAGETVIVTRHGRPAARLVAVEPEPESSPVRMGIDTFRNIPKMEDLEYERDRTPWGDIEVDFG